jgi:hypothetical protein
MDRLSGSDLFSKGTENDSFLKIEKESVTKSESESKISNR